MEIVLFVHGNPPMTKVKPWAVHGTQIVALDIKSSLALTAAGIPHKTSGEYPIPDSNKRAVDFLNAWSSKKLANGKTIKELLVHDRFSFWWCAEFWLFYSFIYKDPLNKIIEAIDFVRTVLNEERPKKVAYFDNQTLFGKVISTLAGKSNVSLTRIMHRRPIQERLNEHIRPWGVKQFLRWHTRARRLAWTIEKLRAHYNPPEKKGKRILAICAYHWRNVEHPVIPRHELGDPYITPIVKQLNEHNVTYVDATQREYVGFKTLKAKARSGQRHILLEQYLSWSAIRKARNALRNLQRTAREIVTNQLFRKSWVFEGIDLWPLIAPQYFCYFDNRLEGHLIDYYCVKEMLAHEKPSIVIYPGEGGDLAYIYFKLCAEAGIPCIGIQHGTLPYNPLTTHTKDAIAAGQPGSIPRPNSILLYGDYYRNFLMKNAHYPAGMLSVTGNLRYDHFINAGKLSREEMAVKYGLDPSKKIMLYATQVMPSPHEGEEISRAVYKAAKELGMQLIVKQHPGEHNDAPYRTLAHTMKINPLIISNASTLELITACDLIIGSESTLDYEAMILGKPVIILNFGSGRKYWLPFVDHGAALGVTKPEDVVPAVKNALFNKKTRTELEKNMQKLVAAHCYKIDGKAAERAAEVVRGLIK